MATVFAGISISNLIELPSGSELLHKNWTKEKEYLPPPTVGKLADLDPAVIVTPEGTSK